MKAELIENGNELLIDVDGRLDTDTSPQLKEKFQDIKDEIETIIFDLEDLEYISSSGLRVLLILLKTPGKNRKKIILRHVRPEILEILEATGFDELMEIQ